MPPGLITTVLALHINMLGDSILAILLPRRKIPSFVPLFCDPSAVLLKPGYTLESPGELSKNNRCPRTHSNPIKPESLGVEVGISIF